MNLKAIKQNIRCVNLIVQIRNALKTGSCKAPELNLNLQVEIVAGGRDLEAFVTEDVDDMNLLMKVLRDDLKLSKISVVNSRLVPFQ